ncbi:MAG: PH domain-containing protein [Culicoidibacterales bacterium]
MNKAIKTKIIRYHLLANSITSVIIVGIMTGLLFVFQDSVSDYPAWLVQIGFILVILGCIFYSFVAPFIKVKRWTYQITPKSVEYTKGIFITSRTVIPVDRIQQIMIIEGPILKKFGLVEAEIITTIKTHRLENMTTAQGQSIADEITTLLHQTPTTCILDESLGAQPDEQA